MPLNTNIEFYIPYFHMNSTHNILKELFNYEIDDEYSTNKIFVLQDNNKDANTVHILFRENVLTLNKMFNRLITTSKTLLDYENKYKDMIEFVKKKYFKNKIVELHLYKCNSMNKNIFSYSKSINNDHFSRINFIGSINAGKNELNFLINNIKKHPLFLLNRY